MSKIIKVTYARIIKLEHIIEIPDNIAPEQAALALEAHHMLGINEIDPKDGSHVDSIDNFEEIWETEVIAEGITDENIPHADQWPEWLKIFEPHPDVDKLPF